MSTPTRVQFLLRGGGHLKEAAYVGPLLQVRSLVDVTFKILPRSFNCITSTQPGRILGFFVAYLAAHLLSAGSLPAEQASDSPVKIFILAGQSNMVGRGVVDDASVPGTMAHLVAKDPDYAFLGDGDGGYKVLDDVWIRYGAASGPLTVGYGSSSSTIGPELGFGHKVGALYDEQVLLIKYAVGGRSLGNDFLPPSSGPYAPPTKDGDPGYHYRRILDTVAEVTKDLSTYFPAYHDQGFEIVGFAWHQGWNDRMNADFSGAYETNMANFINDMRGDLGVPDLPFVIATSAMDPNFDYTQVERAQLAMADPARHPAFDGNVKVVDARQEYNGLTFWQLFSESPRNEGYHWNRNAKTYVNLGLAMGDAISVMVPAACPYRLVASGDADGVSLSWSEGTETPEALQILRNGVEIAALPSLASPNYLDTTAEPGMIDYEFNFAMLGVPCPPLNLSFDAGITDLEAYRLQNSVKLSWRNNLGYAAIEVRRDGTLIEPALSGGATSFVDPAPPGSGTATYSVVPANGSATPTEVTINLDGRSPGNAYIYEPFEDADGTLVENRTGAGLQKRWVAGLG
ncbi:MAG TPA: sialate O-acetylesterase, partial [Opitutales bacterium]|nr:sialate O-acetylesterase [Opitutales bacterium]